VYSLFFQEEQVENEVNHSMHYEATDPQMIGTLILTMGTSPML
jgi:hypothetical protein